MKKIPTLFVREFKNHNVVKCLDKVTEGLEWVLEGEGIPTVKIDGSCCAIINGEFYRRYDAKRGKKAPEGAIPCCDPDPVTGHHPHWIKCDKNNSADKWYFAAYDNTSSALSLEDGTYEAVGVHFQGNPYNLENDILVKHGEEIITDLLNRSYEGIKQYLENHKIEGIVFWKDGEPKCKIKRSDFGFSWNERNKNE